MKKRDHYLRFFQRSNGHMDMGFTDNICDRAFRVSDEFVRGFTSYRNVEPQEVFNRACEFGYDDLVMHLSDNYATITDSIRTAFLHACTTGQLRKANKMCYMAHVLRSRAIGPDEINRGFASSCFDGHLRVSQWLHGTGWVTLQSIRDAFPLSCGNGYLAVAEWLHSHSHFRNSDRHCINQAFRLSCANGHLAVAQWLHGLEPKPDVRSYGDRAFMASCQNRKTDVTLWLLTLCRSYWITMSNDRIVRYGVANSDPVDDFLRGSCDLETLCRERGIESQRNADPSECSICQSSVANIETECGHRSCVVCLIKWLKANGSCMMCRRPVSLDRCKLLIFVSSTELSC